MKKKRETSRDKTRRIRLTILKLEGISRDSMSRLLRRHGLDKDRLASLNEDAWLVRLADIRRNREFPWWNH